MSEAVDFAARIAPEIDRVRIAIAHGIGGRLGPIAAAFGVTPESGGVLAMLRNLPPARRASRSGVDAAFVYQSPTMVQTALDALQAAGLVEVSGDELWLTARGVESIDALYELTAEVVDGLWDGADLDLPSLVRICDAAIGTATESGGDAFRLLAPPYVPDGAGQAVIFAEQLTPLRFHRFDAHVAAWRGAGLSLDQVQSLEDGQLKADIEAETNRRAALAYASLTASERDALLQALMRLPGEE